MTPVAIGQPCGADPRLGGGVTLGEAAPCGLPQVFEDVHEVDHDRDRHAAVACFGVAAVDLVVVAIHQGDPTPLVGRIAPVRLVERLRHDLGRVVGHGSDQPLRVRRGPWWASAWSFLVAAGEGGCWCARRGGGVSDGTDLRHPLAVALLPFGQAGGELPAGLGRCGARRCPQRLGPHDDALAVTAAHERITGRARLPWPLGVELADVAGGPSGERLHHTLAQPLPGGALDGVDRVVENQWGAALLEGLASGVGTSGSAVGRAT